MKQLQLTYIFFMSIFFTPLLKCRHPFRKPNLDFPVITAQWENDSKIYSLRTPYVRLHPLFTVKTEDLYQYLIPKEGIVDKHNPDKAMSSAELSLFIENALKEIRQRKKLIKKEKRLTSFNVLQDKNFNYKKSCGLIVLKFKNYPLVLKLFLEQPETFLQFRSTGLEPTFFFYMGGGANRHLSGFTRPKNRDVLLQKTQKFERWAKHISCPRKWFWLPSDQKDIVLTGNNIAGYDFIQTRIPSVYGIVADEVDINDTTDEISQQIKSRIIMQLCNDLDMYVDPHEKNFVFSRNKLHGRFNIIILDTEHFPTMVGILRRKKFRNHNQWYSYLAGKCVHDMYFQTKRHLANKQGKISELALM